MEGKHEWRQMLIVVDFAIEMAWRGFPLSHGRLKDHVDLMAAARLGRAFPEEGIGRRWTTRFITRHSDELKVVPSRPLEDKRGRAANPAANDLYFKVDDDDN